MPYSWNPEPQGVYPAATGVNFHAGELPSIRRDNPNYEMLMDAIKTIGGVLQQRRSDAIANQILATDNTEAGQLGQSIGGVEGLKASELLRQRLAGEQNTAPDQELMRAKIAKALREPRGSGGGGSFAGVAGNPPTWTDPDGNVWSLNGNGTLGKKIQSANAPSGGLSPLDQRREQLVRETERKAALSTARESLANATGVAPDKIPSVMSAISGYVPGQTAFPALGARGEIGDASEGDYKQRVLDAAEAYKKALAQGMSGADAAPVDNKKARAQQALNDPEATEAEKAQARKILGL